MYFWKDWLKMSFFGIDSVTHNFIEINSCSCQPEIARLWKIRDKLKIADPKEPPLEKNKELYLAKLNKHLIDLINTCSILVVDTEFQLTDKDKLKAFLDSDLTKIEWHDKFNDVTIIDKEKAKLGLDTIEKTILSLKEELNKNIEIVKNSKSNKDLFFDVYFMNYFGCETVLDYVE